MPLGKPLNQKSDIMKVYLDNAATTKVDSLVLEEMIQYFEQEYGNASSIHEYGIKSKKVIEKCKQKISSLLNITPESIIFTSGGSESNNLAIKGYVEKNNIKHIITSNIEHSSIFETCKYLEKKHGIKVTYVPVDNQGILKLDKLETAFTNETGLVTTMHSNNELGTLQPVKQISKICKAKKVTFHTDAVQSIGKLKVDFNLFDMLSLSAHKLYGPKGIGMLYVKQGIKITPQIHGGEHNNGIRSGTYNLPAIVGLTKSIELAHDNLETTKTKIIQLKEKLINGILEIDNSYLNGSRTDSICTIANFRFDYIEGESLLLLLNDEGIYGTTGSACSSRSLSPSRILLSIGLKPEQAHSSLRLSLSKHTTEQQIEYTIEKVKESVNKLRNISPIKNKIQWNRFSNKGDVCE